MIRTYTRTMMIADLEKAEFKVFVYKHCKYNAIENEETEVRYTGVTSWDVIEGGKEAEEIEAAGLVDDMHEYLVLHFNNGDTATFRNSYVDMFIR